MKSGPWELKIESLKRKRVELDERNEYTKVEFMLILSRMQFCSRRLGEREIGDLGYFFLLKVNRFLLLLDLLGLGEAASVF